MLPVKLSDENLQLGPPPGWSDEQCMTVSAYAGVDGSGIPFVVTAWMPSKEDLEAMNAGRPLYAKWCGSVSKDGRPTMAPLALFTMDEQDIINV